MDIWFLKNLKESFIATPLLIRVVHPREQQSGSAVLMVGGHVRRSILYFHLETCMCCYKMD